MSIYAQGAAAMATAVIANKSTRDEITFMVVCLDCTADGNEKMMIFKRGLKIQQKYRPKKEISSATFLRQNTGSYHSLLSSRIHYRWEIR